MRFLMSFYRKMMKWIGRSVAGGLAVMGML